MVRESNHEHAHAEVHARVHVPCGACHRTWYNAYCASVPLPAVVQHSVQQSMCMWHVACGMCMCRSRVRCSAVTDRRYSAARRACAARPRSARPAKHQTPGTSHQPPGTRGWCQRHQTPRAGVGTRDGEHTEEVGPGRVRFDQQSSRVKSRHKSSHVKSPARRSRLRESQVKSRVESSPDTSHVKSPARRSRLR
jgi:hypothetical protein